MFGKKKRIESLIPSVEEFRAKTEQGIRKEQNRFKGLLRQALLSKMEESAEEGN